MSQFGSAFSPDRKSANGLFFGKFQKLADTICFELDRYQQYKNNNQEIPDSYYSQLSNDVSLILDSSNITPDNISNGLQWETKDIFAVLVSQYLVNNKLRQDNNSLREKSALLEAETEDLNEKVKEIQERYDSLLNNLSQQTQQNQLIQQSTASTINYTRQINDLKQQLSDANDRIKIQKQRSEEESNTLQTQIASYKQKISQLEQEVNSAQIDQLKEKRKYEELLEFVSDQFSTTEKGDIKRMLEEIRSKLALPPPTENDQTLLEGIQEKMRRTNKLYNEILVKFFVADNSTNVAEDIQAFCENQYRQQILNKLHSDFDFDRNVTDIVKAVHRICEDVDGIVPEIVKAFNLPKDTTHVNVINELQKLFNQINDLQQEIDQIKQENEELRQKEKSNKLLLSLLETEPVVFEKIDDSPQELVQYSSAQNQAPVQSRGLNLEQSATYETNPYTDLYEEDSYETEQTNDTYNSNLQHIESIAQELDLAQQSLKANEQMIQDITNDRDLKIEQVKKEVKQYYRSKIEKLTQIIEDLAPNEDKLVLLKKKAKQIKQQSDLTKQQLQETEQKLQQEIQTNQQLTMQLQEQNTHLQNFVSENNRLTQELEETKQNLLSLTQNETQINQASLDKLLQDTSEQLVQTSKELAQEAKYRNDLSLIVNKQQQLLLELENKLHEYETRDKQKKELEEEFGNQNSKNNNNKITEHEYALINEDTYLEALSSIDTENIKEEVDDLMTIARNEQNDAKEKFIRTLQMLCQRINEIIDQRNKLQEYIDNIRDNKPHIEWLNKTINEQLKFVERIACSNDKNITDDLRQQMAQNAARTHKYLQEHCIGFTSEQSLFDDLGLNADPLALKEHLDQVFQKYENLENDSEETNELLILLRQAIAQNLVLQRYSTEAQQQCQKYMNELKVLKNDMKMFRQDCERQTLQAQEECKQQIEELQKQKEEAEEKIKNVEKILRANITNPDIAAPIERCLGELHEGAEFEISENDYIQSMQKELQENRGRLKDAEQKIEEKEQELSELRETCTREINEIQAASGLLENETQTIIQNQNTELTNLRKELQNCKSELDSMRRSFEQVKQSNSDLHAKLINEKKRAEIAEQNTKDEVNKIKERATAKLDKAMKLLAAEQKSKIDKLQQRIKQIQQELKQRNTDLQEKDEIIKQQEEAKNQLSLSCSQMEEELQNHGRERDSQISTLRQQNSDLTERAQTAELEKKILQNKLKSLEEKQQRDKNHYESQLSLVKFSNEQQMAAKLDQTIDEGKQKIYNLLKEICTIFQEYVDVTVPISENSVLHMLTDIQTKLKLLQRENDNATENERQLREIRLALQAPKGLKTTTVVQNYVESYSKMKEKLEQMEKKLKEHVAGQDSTAAEWEEWATRVYKAVSDDAEIPRVSRELRLKLEELILSASGSKQLANKLDTLRFQKKFMKRYQSLLTPDKQQQQNKKKETTNEQQQQNEEEEKQEQLQAEERTNEEESKIGLLPIICDLMFIRRVMKMSHVLPSEFSFNKGGSTFENSQQDNIFVLNFDNSQNTGSPSSPRQRKSTIATIFGASIQN